MKAYAPPPCFVRKVWAMQTPADDAAAAEIPRTVFRFVLGGGRLRLRLRLSCCLVEGIIEPDVHGVLACELAVISARRGPRLRPNGTADAEAKIRLSIIFWTSEGIGLPVGI